MKMASFEVNVVCGGGLLDVVGQAIAADKYTNSMLLQSLD